MTKQEKINWLENATNDELIEQFKWTFMKIGNPNKSWDEMISAAEDEQLVIAELKKRLDK